MLEVGLILLVLASISYARIGCKNMDGNDVDWFAAIKLPSGSDESEGYSFVYFDSTQKGWKKSDKLINNKKSAIGATIDQIYGLDKKKMFNIAYNDDVPGKEVDSGRGHSKGVALFDEKTGFWILHSVPNYPPTDKYDYPATGTKYAQSFLCLSLDAHVLEEIGQYMRFAQVTPFITNLPKFHETLAPVLVDVVNRKSLTRSDTVFTKTAHIETLKGKKITAFSKHKKSNFDLWHDFIAQNITAPMAVETWRNGAAKNVGARCGGGKHNVYDITNLVILNMGYSSSKDHSKWGVSLDGNVPIVCIGDVNRQESQFKRGGGAVCMKDKYLWKTFYNSIGNYIDCNNNLAQVQKFKSEPSEPWTNFSPKFDLYN